MTTTPPTQADCNAWMDANPAMSQWFASNALTSPGQTVTAWIVAYTRVDGTKVFTHIQDPSKDSDSAVLLKGSQAVYGAVMVYVYQLAWTPPTAVQLQASQTVQDAANNPSNWAVV